VIGPRIQSLTAATKPKLCLHCSESFFPTVDQSTFCCKGCAFAYRFIHELNLEVFYPMRESAAASNTALPSMKPRTPTWEPTFFDQTDFNSRFVTETETEQLAHVLLPDLTCYACIWLCEHAVTKTLPEARISICLSDRSAEIRLPKGKVLLSQVVEVLGRLGYEVIPDSAERKRDLQRMARTRMGIALLCATNIMLFSAAEYVDLPFFTGTAATLDPEMKTVFRSLQAAFALPVLLFSALPFWKGALRTLLTGKLGIDLPISISLAMTSFFSFRNVLLGTGDVYFDSLSAGISLLLIGRLVQERSLIRAEKALRLSAESQGDWVRKITPSGTEVVRAAAILKGDRIQVLPGDVIPLKSRVIEGASYFSAERITGEPTPASVEQGQPLDAQVLNLTSTLVVEAAENGAEAYWEKASGVLSRLRSTKADWSRRAEKFASLFFAGVCLVAIACVVSFSGSTEGINRAIAALLIACPCAFGFAIPLSYSSACAYALSKGVVFRSQHAFEILSRANVFLFDKTGTLTRGHLSAQLNTLSKPWDKESVEAINVLTHYSLHPAAKAIGTFLERAGYSLPVGVGLKVNETIGQGVSYFNSRGTWTLGSWELLPKPGHPDRTEPKAPRYHAQSVFSLNDEVIAVFDLFDAIDSSAQAVVDHLRHQNIPSYILSGDTSLEVDRIAETLKISILQKGASPLQKLAQIQENASHTIVAMVGNGVNDSFALAGAQVGIAVAHSTPAAKHAADIVLTEEGLHGVVTALTIARKSLKTVLRTFSFAAAYNLVGLTLAVMGYINPLLAAILMPLASLIIVRLSLMRPDPASAERAIAL
jgi:P-type Cu2+ transporter